MGTKNTTRRGLVAALCLLIAAWCCPAHAQKQTLALVDVAVEGDDLTNVADLAAAARRGFGSGPFVVSKKPPTAAAAACEAGTCIQSLGHSFGATFLAWMKIRSTAARYEVEIRVLHADSGETLTTDAVTCANDDLCPPMPQTVQRLAKEAARKTHGRWIERDASPASQPDPEPQTTPSTPPSPPPYVFASPRVYDVTEPRSPRWLPWTLAAVSAAALTSGGVLQALDGTCSGEPCKPRELSAAGIGLSLVGLIAGASAAWIWLQEPNEPPARSVALQGWVVHDSAGLSIAGRWK